MSSITMKMVIEKSYFEDSEQDNEKGEPITVQVENIMVFLIGPGSTEIRLTIEELNALYQFAILEAKQQGYEL